MALQVVRPWHRVRVGGTQIEVEGPVVQNEQLEGWTTYVAEFTPFDSPAITEGVDADIYAIELSDLSIAPQYTGVVRKKLGSSNPERPVFQLQGPLGGLRRVSIYDFGLSDISDGQAVQFVLAHCGVPFDSGDIADAGYILGEHQPVYWRGGQPGWEVIKELDSVFGMATIEVGDGRVVRFPYDRAPSTASMYRTYTKGEDADVWQLDRESWGIDEVRNLVKVTGATWDDDDKCARTPWARAESPNDVFESDYTRVATLDFKSDVIQDTTLARAVAERLMRWYNRLPDKIILVAQNDPGMSPGRVIGVKDGTYGVDLTADATTKPYLVLNIDRRGHEMTLTCVGGDDGEIGTVTYGVEKRCNKDVSTVPGPGDFTPPTPTVPPLVPIDGYDCLLHGGPGGECPDECAAPTAPASCTTTGWAEDFSLLLDYDWKLSGSVELTDDSDALRVGVHTTGGTYAITIAGSSYYSGIMLAPHLYEFLAPAEYSYEPGSAPIGTQYNWLIQYDASEDVATFYVEWDDNCATQVWEILHPDMTGALTFSEEVGAPIRTTEAIKHSCGYVEPPPPGGDPIPLTWNDGPSFSQLGVLTKTTDSLTVDFTTETGEYESLTNIYTEDLFSGDTTGPADVEITGTLNFGGSNKYAMGLVVYGHLGFNCSFTLRGTNHNVTPALPTPHLKTLNHHFGSFAGDETGANLTALSFASDINFRFLLEASTGKIEVELTQGLVSHLITHTHASDWQNAGTADTYRLIFTVSVDGGSAGALNHYNLDTVPIVFDNIQVILQ